MEMGYRVKRWKVIPNGFDLNRFKPDASAKSQLLKELNLEKFSGDGDLDGTAREVGRKNIVIIGFIARNDPMKDHATFFEAGCTLLGDRSHVHFVCAGKGIDFKKISIATQIPERFRSHFHLLGERDDVEDITAALDIACSISLGEGFPNTIGEAMACGVPCVATDVGDSARILGETGAIIPTKDPRALANAWNELIDMGEAGRRILGDKARKRVKENFEISRVAKQYEDVYTSLIVNG